MKVFYLISAIVFCCPTLLFAQAIEQTVAERLRARTLSEKPDLTEEDKKELGDIYRRIPDDKLTRFFAANGLIRISLDIPTRTEIVNFYLDFYSNARGILNSEFSQMTQNPLFVDEVIEHQRTVLEKFKDPQFLISTMGFVSHFSKIFGGEMLHIYTRGAVVNYLKKHALRADDFSQTSVLAFILDRDIDDPEISYLFAQALVAYHSNKLETDSPYKSYSSMRNVALRLLESKSLTNEVLEVLAQRPSAIYSVKTSMVIRSLVRLQNVRNGHLSEPAEKLLTEGLRYQAAADYETPNARVHSITVILRYFRSRSHLINGQLSASLVSLLSEPFVIDVALHEYPEILRERLGVSFVERDWTSNSDLVAAIFREGDEIKKRFLIASLRQAILRAQTASTEGQEKKRYSRIANVLSSHIRSLPPRILDTTAGFLYVDSILNLAQLYSVADPSLEFQLMSWLTKALALSGDHLSALGINETTAHEMVLSIVAILTNLPYLSEQTVQTVTSLKGHWHLNSWPTLLAFAIAHFEHSEAQVFLVEILDLQNKLQQEGRSDPLFEQDELLVLLNTLARCRHLDLATKEMGRQALSNARLRRAALQETPQLFANFDYPMNEEFLGEIIQVATEPPLPLTELLDDSENPRVLRRAIENAFKPMREKATDQLTTAEQLAELRKTWSSLISLQDSPELAGLNSALAAALTGIIDEARFGKYKGDLSFLDAVIKPNTSGSLDLIRKIATSLGPQIRQLIGAPSRALSERAVAISLLLSHSSRGKCEGLL